MIICITGMHRSGTSLTARWFQASGLHIGRELLGPARGNEFGHFEDKDFLDLNQRFLEKAHASHMPVEPVSYTHDDADRDAAQALAEQRRDLEHWGWKDPRTTLFLTFWADVAPEARFVLLFRHPLLVLSSLLRRGADPPILIDPNRALQTWAVHNRLVLEFTGSHPERVVLCDIDRVMDAPDAFARLVEEQFGFRLSDPAEAIEPGVFKRPEVADEALARFWDAYPDLADLQARLARAADLASPFDPPAEAAGAGMSDLELRRFLESIWPGLHEQVQAHLSEWFGRVTELEKGKAWLEEQYHNYYQKIRSCEERLAELQANPLRRWLRRLRRPS